MNRNGIKRRVIFRSVSIANVLGMSGRPVYIKAYRANSRRLHNGLCGEERLCSPQVDAPLDIPTSSIVRAFSRSESRLLEVEKTAGMSLHSRGACQVY